MRLISFGPFELLADNMAELLTPQQPPEVQLAAVRALAIPTHAKVGALLLGSWSSYSPAVRREATEALLARPERVARSVLVAVVQLVGKIAGVVGVKDSLFWFDCPHDRIFGSVGRNRRN